MRIRQMGFSSRLKAHRHLLTLETLKFIVEFLDDGNATAAALRSGIPETYASRQGQWLKKLPMVKSALESEVQERDLRKLRAAVKVIEEKMRECSAILDLESLDSEK
jgi:phage terminase small subunit